MGEREPNGGVRYSTREMFDEIRRAIDRLGEELKKNRHDLKNELSTLSLRVSSLEHEQKDTIRRLAENDARAEKYIPLIEHLLQEETLSSQLKKAGWTRRERMLAYGLFLFAFIGALGTIVSLIVLTRGG